MLTQYHHPQHSNNNNNNSSNSNSNQPAAENSTSLGTTTSAHHSAENLSLYLRNNSVCSSSQQKQIASRRSVIRMLGKCRVTTGGHIKKRKRKTNLLKKFFSNVVAVVIAFFVCYSPFHAQRVLASMMTRYSLKSQTYFFYHTLLNHISGELRGFLLCCWRWECRRVLIERERQQCWRTQGKEGGEVMWKDFGIGIEKTVCMTELCNYWQALKRLTGAAFVFGHSMAWPITDALVRVQSIASRAAAAAWQSFPEQFRQWQKLSGHFFDIFFNFFIISQSRNYLLLVGYNEPHPLPGAEPEIPHRLPRHLRRLSALFAHHPAGDYLLKHSRRGKLLQAKSHRVLLQQRLLSPVELQLWPCCGAPYSGSQNCWRPLSDDGHYHFNNGNGKQPHTKWALLCPTAGHPKHHRKRKRQRRLWQSQPRQRSLHKQPSGDAGSEQLLSQCAGVQILNNSKKATQKAYSTFAPMMGHHHHQHPNRWGL